MDTAKIVPGRLGCDGLAYRASGTQILTDIDLSLDKASTLAVIGPSGSGKTSLLRCLALFNPPTGGTLRLDGQPYVIDGKPVYQPWELRRQVMLVSQSYALIPNITGWDNITIGIKAVLGKSPAEATDRARYLASEFGLEDSLLGRYPHSFSGGQAQRVALVRALALRPKVLLLDEVTSALDPETVGSVVEAVRKIRQEGEYDDMAIILVTHLMQFAREFADRIAFICDGKILKQAPSRTFFSDVDNEQITRFLANVRLPY